MFELLNFKLYTQVLSFRTFSNVWIPNFLDLQCLLRYPLEIFIVPSPIILLSFLMPLDAFDISTTFTRYALQVRMAAQLSRGDREDRKRAEQGPLDSAIHEASGRERRCKSLSCSINPTLDTALPEIIYKYTYVYGSFSGVTITRTWISKKEKHQPRKGEDKEVRTCTVRYFRSPRRHAS